MVMVRYAFRSVICAAMVLLLLLVLVALPPESEVPARSADAPVPNILVILTDDQTVQELNGKAMPYVSSQPEGHWVRFPNSFVNTPLCCPARATILSGQYAHHTGVQNNHQGNRFDDSATVATWLDAAGYETALVGKYLNSYPFNRGETYIPPAWDFWAAFKSTAGYYDYTLNDNGTLVSYGSKGSDYSTDVLRDKALTFMRGAAKPFFLYFAPYAAHEPVIPAPKYASKFAGLEMPRSPNFNEADVSDKPEWISSKPLLTERQQQNNDEDRRDQYRTLRSVDDATKAFFAELSSQGILDETVVIFMSDNGHTLGEHRTHVKPCEYEECQAVPLRIRDPLVAAGKVSQLVSNVDIASTLTDLAGTSPTIAQDGSSLLPLLRGTATSWRTGVLLEWLGETVEGKESAAPPYWGIRTSRYKYVELDTGEKELYDLSVDPYELQNVAGDASYAAVQDDLAARLENLKQ
ncbi:MAG: sulfatase [Actinomycetota bacterium]